MIFGGFFNRKLWKQEESLLFNDQNPSNGEPTECDVIVENVILQCEDSIFFNECNDDL